MKEYRSWNSYPGLEGWQDGMSPHGDFLKYYINNVASANTRHPRNGAILIKENYGAKNDTKLGSITVMKNPKNMYLAGRVAKGMSMRCISCHSNADGGDFHFIND